MRAISYARATNPSSIEIVTVCTDEKEANELYEQWEKADLKVPLISYIHLIRMLLLYN